MQYVALTTLQLCKSQRTGILQHSNFNLLPGCFRRQHHGSSMIFSYMAIDIKCCLFLMNCNQYHHYMHSVVDYLLLRFNRLLSSNSTQGEHTNISLMHSTSEFHHQLLWRLCIYMQSHSTALT